MRTRRGSIATQTALMLPVLIGAGALAVDLGFMFMALAQARVVTDMAVLAAASGYQDNADETTAKNRAIGVAGAHMIGGGSPALDPSDIIWGFYDGSSYDWTVTYDNSNAVRVQVAEAGPSFFSQLWGNQELSGHAESVAVVQSGPAGAVECFLPIALPHCAYPVVPAVNPAPRFINMGDDRMGWAHPNGVNTPTVIAELKNLCAGNLLVVGDNLPLGNGVNTPIVRTVYDLINGDEVGNRLPWNYENFPSGPPTYGQPPDAFPVNQTKVDPGAWGFNVSGPIAIVDVGGTQGDCSGVGSFNGAPEIMGFTYGILYDARLGNAATKGFMIQVDFVNEYDFGLYVDPDAIGNVIANEPPQLVL